MASLALVALGAATPAMAATAPTIGGPEFPSIAFGQALDLQYQVTGDPAPTVAITAGALPEGTQLDTANMVITGTPSAPGTYAFTLTASSGVPPAAHIDVTLIVNAPATFTGTPPMGNVGTAYAFDYTLGGWPLPTTTLSSGSLPPGLALSADGKITGSPTVAGTFDFIVQVANSVGQLNYDQSITVDGPPTISGPTEILVQEGIFVSETYTFTGEPTPNVSISGELPTGLAFTTQDQADGSVVGLISGTVPYTVGGEFRSFVRASNTHTPDAELPVLVTVLQAAWVGTGPDIVTAGDPVEFQFLLRGFPVPHVSIVEGALPAGMTLSADGLLQGTPALSGVYYFTVQASNGIGEAMVRPVTMLVQGPPRISGPTDPTADQWFTDVSLQYVSDGYPAAPVTFTSGALPPGLSFDPDTSEVTGTPEVAGVFEFTLTASNGIDPDAELHVTFTVTGPPTSVGYADSATVGVPYRYQIYANGYPSSTFSIIDGTLPEGLTLSAGGILEGTATISGVYTFTMHARNDYGEASSPVTMLVYGPPRLQGDGALTAPVGAEFSTTYLWSGYPMATMSTSGTLPPGITLDPDTAELSGTVGGPGQTYEFEIVASNGFEPDAVLPVTFVASTFPDIHGPPADASAGVPYEYQLRLLGYPTPSVSIETGELPPGLSLSETGALSGTVEQPGDYRFTVSVTNAAGSIELPLTLRVVAVAPSISTTSLPPGVAGTPYNAQLTAVGTGPITWALATASDPLPPGLTLDAQGAISGTPTSSDLTEVVFVARNAVGEVSKTLPISIAALPGPPTITALAGGNAQTTVTFAPGTAGTSPTTSYEVAAHNITNTTLPDVVDSSPGSPAIVGGLVNGDAYTFTVRGVSSDGASAWSPPSNALTVGVAPTFDAETPPTATIGEPYRYTFAIGGLPIPDVTMPGITLPDGLTFTTESNGTEGTITGVIAGTPASDAQTTFIFVQAINALGEATTSFTIEVAGPLGAEPDHMVVTGSGQSAPVNTAFENPIMVTVETAGGQPVGGATVQLDVVLDLSTGDATFVQSGSIVLIGQTGADGTFEANVRAGATAGAVTIWVRVRGIDTQTVDLNVTSAMTATPPPTVTPTPAPASDPTPAAASRTSGDGLAATGANRTSDAIALGIGMLVVGGILVAFRIRQRRRAA